MRSAVTPGPGFVRAWDLPTRLCKWLLVVLVAMAWASNRFGADSPMWHKANGYAILVLVVFRLLWGVFGGSTARFQSFVRGPEAAVAHAADLVLARKKHYLGHTPLGGWMVMALLAALGIQACLGLYSADEDRLIIEGPLARTVPDSVVDQAAHFHALGFKVILALITVHVAANLYYDLRLKAGLIRGMMTGRKPARTYVDQQEAVGGRPIAAVACLVVSVVLVFGTIIQLGGPR
jgi:cytochrome b